MIGTLLLLGAIGYIAYFYLWTRRKYPPGPFPLPLIGNVPQLLMYTPGYSAYEEFKKKYGSVYTFWLGPNPMVMISDYNLMKETFVKDGDTYADKLKISNITEEVRGGMYGILEANGDLWREHRRFALHQLRDLGLGKMKMEEKILTEVEEFLKCMEQHAEDDVHSMVRRAIGSLINQLLFGYRFYGDNASEFDHLRALLEKQNKIAADPFVLILVIFKWARNLPYLNRSWKVMMEFKDEFFKFFDEQIEEHRKEVNFDVEDSTDFCEAYLREQRNRELAGDKESFSDIQLSNVCMDLWSAGLETTSSTLNWSIIFLINHPEVQDKLHEELDRVIGSNRLVSTSDKNNLPYVQATVNECQRFVNLLPVNIPHCVRKDVVIDGKSIPAETGVVAQITNLLYDSNTFPDTAHFNPDNFLDAGGNLRKIESFLPFSIGKRQCPGEGLARMELYLFIANLVNRYKLLPDGDPPTMVRKQTNYMQPGPYKYKLVPRFE